MTAANDNMIINETFEKFVIYITLELKILLFSQNLQNSDSLHWGFGVLGFWGFGGVLRENLIN